MILNKFKILSLLTGFVVVLPVTIVLGYFAYLYTISAFPSYSLAVKRYEESGIYEFPKDATDLYFRMAMPSPLDRGGSALRFSAGDAELSNILNTVPAGFKWKVLEQNFLCNCLQCIRYSEFIEVPAGSLYWRRNKGSGDYVLLAVNQQAKQVYWCEQDT